jgi:hypothetical protein
MRIIRNHDHDDEHDHNHDDEHRHRRHQRGPVDDSPLADTVGDTPLDEFDDILGDEFSRFLAAAVAAADNYRAAPRHHHDTPAETLTPQPRKPTPPLVSIDDADDPDTVEGDDAPGRTVPEAGHPGAGISPRLKRAGVGGSFLVVTACALAGWGEPAAVTVPIGVYGAGWIAYLWWNAALRPPILQVLTVIATAISRGVAALITGMCRAIRAGITRAEAARARHENNRTATT